MTSHRTSWGGSCGPTGPFCLLVLCQTKWFWCAIRHANLVHQFGWLIKDRGWRASCCLSCLKVPSQTCCSAALVFHFHLVMWPACLGATAQPPLWMKTGHMSSWPESGLLVMMDLKHLSWSLGFSFLKKGKRKCKTPCFNPWIYFIWYGHPTRVRPAPEKDRETYANKWAETENPIQRSYRARRLCVYVYVLLCYLSYF